ncbi:hypothetical protein TNCV_4030791 [Trichonephila clavipes]|nr:hypothetical protein TNCV_4030791 [Trichonephila clavipes]
MIDFPTADRYAHRRTINIYYAYLRVAELSITKTCRRYYAKRRNSVPISDPIAIGLTSNIRRFCHYLYMVNTNDVDPVLKNPVFETTACITISLLAKRGTDILQRSTGYPPQQKLKLIGFIKKAFERDDITRAVINKS